MLSLEFVPEPEWTLHFCAVAFSNVICSAFLFTARPLRAIERAHRTCRELDGRFTVVPERQVPCPVREFPPATRFTVA
jgi:hypothetical protein